MLTVTSSALLPLSAAPDQLIRSSECGGVRVSVRGWSSGRPVPAVLFGSSVCVAGLRSASRLRLSTLSQFG